MAHLYRLIVFLGCLFLLSPAANASFQSTGSFYVIGFGSSTATTRTQACVNAVGAQAYVSYTSPSWYCYNKFGAGGYGVATNSESCPASSTLSNGLCTCAATYTESNGTCVAPPKNDCAELNTLKTPAGEYSGVGSVGTYRLCDTAGVSSSGDPALPGCVVVVNADFAVTIAGIKKWVGTGSFSGAKCSPAVGAPPASDGQPTPPSSPTNGAPTPCPPGKVPGTVNGTSVCVDPGVRDETTRTNGTTTTTTNPDGSTTGTTTGSTTDCSGSTCTTTTTTTTTTTPPGGSPTSETTSSTSTCTRGASGCGGEEPDPSKFGGSCGAAFVCGGDAIMCAVALEQHQRNCALFVDPSAESTLYETEKGKTGTQYQNENVSLGAGNFNQSNALGAGAQCIQDRSVTVMGNVVVLPFSIVCSTLQHFGTILIFVSFLLAYRIVSRD